MKRSRIGICLGLSLVLSLAPAAGGCAKPDVGQEIVASASSEASSSEESSGEIPISEPGAEQESAPESGAEQESAQASEEIPSSAAEESKEPPAGPDKEQEPESAAQTPKPKDWGVGKRLLKAVGDQLIGEDDTGKISILYTVEKNEKVRENPTQAISYHEDILYTVYGYEYEGDVYTSYVDIFSMHTGEAVERIPAYNLTWMTQDDALLFFYMTYSDTGQQLLHIKKIVSEDGVYCTQEVYQEFADKVNDQQLQLWLPGSIKIDGGKNGCWLVGEQEDKLALYNSRGDKKKEITTAYPVSMVQALNERGMVYTSTEYTDDYYSSIRHTMYLDFDSREEICLYDSEQDELAVSLLALEGNHIYYYKEDVSEYGHSRYITCIYDIRGRQETVLYEQETLPGEKKSWQMFSASAFMTDGERVVFMKPDETDVYWYEWNGGEQPQNTGLTAFSCEALKYGKVTYDSKTFTAPDGGETVYQYYVERLQLTTQDAGTVRINSALQKNYEETMDYVETQAERYLESLEDTYGAVCSYDRQVSVVQTLGSHYLSVAFSGYEYWGGAHGMPFEDWYLFDRESGKQIYLRDLYHGTEEHFKDVVAKYTVADWKAEENPYKYYGWNDEMSAYQSLYENARIDMPVHFEEDVLVVAYAPYEIGPYAAGTIEIEIPYGELGILIE